MLKPIRMRTFRDYGPRFGWFAYCRRCFHQRTLTLEDIERRIGLDADVNGVRRRLCCGACGARDALLHRHYHGDVDMDKNAPSPFAHLYPAAPPKN